MAVVPDLQALADLVFSGPTLQAKECVWETAAIIVQWTWEIVVLGILLLVDGGEDMAGPQLSNNFE